ncbi:MAG: lytic murein transglycosylase [Sphingopyxis sp.]|nr:lytic murein transglycosylase [Sphingopyxis sp.]
MRFIATALGALLIATPGTAENTPPRVQIVTSDVERFYALYDDPALAADPDALATRYLADASPGLKEFMVMRRITPERVAKTLREKPDLYRDARGCAGTLDSVRGRLTAAADRLAMLYPQAIFPPITIAVSRGAPVAAANGKGLYVSLEALCAAKFFEADDEDRFVHVIAHEYVHAQQPLAQVESDSDTVLHAALVEGAAEFIAEQIGGSVAYTHLHRWAAGREQAVERDFLAEKDNKANGSRWMYNQLGTRDWPGDLGYWVGYRIVKSHYGRAPDKAAAIEAIIKMKDPAAFLAESGWTPGMKL